MASRTFVIITTQTMDIWLQRMRLAIAELGESLVVSSRKAAVELVQKDCAMIIIDSAVSRNIVPFISKLHTAHPALPIVITTLTQAWDTREAWHAGVREIIQKTSTVEEIRSILKNLLSGPPGTGKVAAREIHPPIKATLLLADNDPTFLEGRKEFLEKAGYAVICAGNPTEAKRILEIGGIDLAILDIRLEDDDNPRDKSGLVLAKRTAREIPKIILTGFPTFENVREALRPQLDDLPAAVDFLTKNEGALALLVTVEDILGMRSRMERRAGHPAKVFIAYGHDTQILKEVRELLHGVGIQPIILFEQADQFDTIFEKVERCSREADFAIVLLTRDDIGYAKKNPVDVKYRARQNVIFEMGYMAGRLGRRRVRMLYQPGVEIPSDLLGVLYNDLDSEGKWKKNLLRELGDAGIIPKVKR